MIYALELIAALAGFFLLVPGVVLISTGSWRSAVEAAKGYGMVWLVLFVIPGAIGGVIAGFIALTGS